MIMIICIFTVFICGLFLLLGPKNMIVNRKRLKDGQNFDDEVKKVRKLGMILLICTIIFLLTSIL